MPRNATKVIGAESPCFRCGKTMFCKGKEYQGETKPQWQNADGEAHYTSNGDCKGEQPSQINNMPPPGIKPLVSQKVKLEDIKLDDEVISEVLTVTKAASQILKTIELGVWEELGDTSPAHVGLYVKQISDKLLNTPDIGKILKGLKVK